MKLQSSPYSPFMFDASTGANSGTLVNVGGARRATPCNAKANVSSMGSARTHAPAVATQQLLASEDAEVSG